MKGVGGIAAGLVLGNLGFKVRGVTAQDVVNNAAYFKEILKKSKVIGFKGMRPTDREHMQMMEAIFYGDANSTLPYGGAGLLSDQMHSGIKEVERKDDLENFLTQNWHVDNAFYESPPCLTSIHMTTYDVEDGYGDTGFISLTGLYEDLPLELKQHVENAKFLGGTGAEERDIVAHRALRTHPDTGETMLYWTGPGTQLDGGPQDWFDALRDWIDSYCANKKNRWWWQWDEGDVIVWDNRAVMHGFLPGWERQNRIFQRVEVGKQKPFYEPDSKKQVNEHFGDVIRPDSHQADTSRGPNPDHIPLVFTKGFYALEEVDHLYQTVTLFVIADESGDWREDVNQLAREIDDDLFTVYVVQQDENNQVFRNLLRYHKSKLADSPLAGSMFLCSRNGDFHCFWEPEMDLFQYDNPDPTRNAIPQIRAYIQWHPDMRHAGHAWHYPDWFDHQPLQFRPWDYQNLPFMQYIDWGKNPPPEDFLVQFAVDTVWGCFNHLKNDDDRLRVVERIHDYIGYMLELNEHEASR